MAKEFENVDASAPAAEFLRERFRERRVFTSLEQSWSYSHGGVRKIAYVCYGGSAQLTVREHHSQGKIIHQSPINAGDEYHTPRNWGNVHVEFKPTSIPTDIYMHVEWD